MNFQIPLFTSFLFNFSWPEEIICLFFNYSNTGIIITTLYTETHKIKLAFQPKLFCQSFDISINCPCTKIHSLTNIFITIAFIAKFNHLYFGQWQILLTFLLAFHIILYLQHLLWPFLAIIFEIYFLDKMLFLSTSLITMLFFWQ